MLVCSFASKKRKNFAAQSYQPVRRLYSTHGRMTLFLRRISVRKVLFGLSGEYLMLAPIRILLRARSLSRRTGQTP